MKILNAETRVMAMVITTVGITLIMNGLKRELRG